MSESRPNIVLIVSEDHGPHLGCYGDPNARTPNLDRLAGEGARFVNHYTTCAICSPGRASILTGLHAHQNGQINLATHRYAMYRPFENLTTLAKKAGYRTARLGKLHVLPEAAFEFDYVWTDSERQSFQHRDMPFTTGAAGKFLKEAPDDPFLLYMCYSDAHLPMLHQSHGLPEKPMAGDEVELPGFCPVDAPHMRDRLAGYYNCLERLDAGIGMLLDEVKKQTDRETIVIFTTDHGQQFIRGKVTCYEGGLRTSMILHAPGRIGSGMVCDRLTSHVDVLPTILEFMGEAPLANRPGASLLPLARGEEVEWRDYLVGEWTGAPRSFYPQRSIRDGRYKLIVNYLAGEPNVGAGAYLAGQGFSYRKVWETQMDEEDLAATPPDLRKALERSINPPAEELYDLENDPYEIQNLAGDSSFADVQDRLRSQLVEWQKATGDRIAEPEVLKALGEMHDRISDEFYPEGGLPLASERAKIKWEYHKWIDPGIPV